MGCILCNRKRCKYRAMYVPTTDAAKQAVGTPTGKVRTVWYDVCHKCRKQPGSLSRIEQIIETQFALTMGHDRN